MSTNQQGQQNAVDSDLQSLSKAENRKRIVFFATQLYALACGRTSGFGGAETELWNVASGLAQDTTFDVRALTLTDETSQPQLFGSIKLYPVSPPRNLNYSDAWIKRRRAVIKYFLGLYNALRRQRADIYFTKLASPEASMVWLASRLSGAGFIFRIEHDWETNSEELTRNIFRGSKVGAKLFLHCLRRADLVIAQTYSQATALKQNFGVDAVIIPNGHIIPPDDAIEHDYDRRDTILWIGRAHPMKRPSLFLDFAARFNGFDFTMVMAPSNEHPDLFDKIKERADQQPNVTFTGGLPPQQVNRLYQQARLLVLTSEAEGFSNVLIEAMKYGSPVLSLEHNPNGILAVVDDSPTIAPCHGYCTNDNFETASKVIEKMLTDQPFWMECHGMLPDFVFNNFGLEHVLDLYRQQFQCLGEAS